MIVEAVRKSNISPDENKHIENEEDNYDPSI